jgi:hypothetical protein
VEEEVLAHIDTIHASAAPSGYPCLRLVYHSSKSLCLQRWNRQRIIAFRQIKQFTGSVFGNGTSPLRNEIKADEEVVKKGSGNAKVKVDSGRLASVWNERLENEVYDM